MLEVFSPSFLSVWNQTSKKSTNKSVALRFFDNDLTNSQNLGSWGLISPQTVLIFPKIFLNF